MKCIYNKKHSAAVFFFFFKRDLQNPVAPPKMPLGLWSQNFHELWLRSSSGKPVFLFENKTLLSGRPLVQCPCMSLEILIFTRQFYFRSLLGGKNGINRLSLLLSNLPQGSAGHFPKDKYCSKGRICYVCKMPVRIFLSHKMCVPLPIRIVTRENLPCKHASKGKRAMARCLLHNIFYSILEEVLRGRTLLPFGVEMHSGS